MKDGKNIIIGALLVAIMVMAVGYAAFAQQLTINGNATIAGEWDVEITGIEKTYTGTAKDSTGKPTFTATSATFDTILSAPGDAAEYTITVENKGTIDAKLDSITLTPEDNEADAIIYTIVSAPTMGTKLAAGQSTTVVIKVEYDDVDEIPTEKSKTFTGVIDYVQSTN